MTNRISGTVTPGFERVEDAFRANFRDYGEVGAAFSVMHKGELVVDLWGGMATTRKPWKKDTIVNVFSTSKGVVSLAAHMLFEQGEVDPTKSFIRYAPSFKGSHTLRGQRVGTVLSHRSQLAFIDHPLPPEAMYDWNRMIEALTKSTERSYGSGYHKVTSYHALTFGFLVGELVKEVTGQTIGEFVQDEISKPLGIDFFIGVPSKDLQKCADMIPSDGEYNVDSSELRDAIRNPDSDTFRAYCNPPPNGRNFMNLREWRRSEIPSANGTGNARALATVYGSMVTDSAKRIISAETLERILKIRAEGYDTVLHQYAKFGWGFSLPHDEFLMGSLGWSFGASGLGGSIAFGDALYKLGIAYTPNKMHGGLAMAVDPRAHALIKATYNSIQRSTLEDLARINTQSP